jgi:hypothetical protein
MALLTETNTIDVERRVMSAAVRKLNQVHHHLSCDFEHGQWWSTCLDCGAQWSVVDTSDGLDFEQVTEGDGYCERDF